jgi:hypothetical protein
MSASVLWVDANGFLRITRINTTTGMAALLLTMLACTNADWLQSWESALATNPAAAPVPAVYQAASQIASLTFVCADGTQTVLQLLAPKLAIFLADGVTVDITNPSVVALATAAIGTLTNTAGSPATALVSGTLGT